MTHVQKDDICIANNGAPYCNRAEPEIGAVVATLWVTVYNPPFNLHCSKYIVNVSGHIKHQAAIAQRNTFPPVLYGIFTWVHYDSNDCY